MCSLRRFLAIALFVVPLAAEAQVRLVIRNDGTKAISNLGSARGRGRAAGVDYNWLAKQRNRSTQYDALVERYSRAHGLDPLLVKAVIQVESNFDASRVSRKGARGLMQLMPGTARRFGVSRVHDPEQNIRGGTAYLAALMKLFRGDLQRVLAGYNAGENAVLRYGGIPPYEETQTYVRKALTVYYGRPHGGAVNIRAGSRPVLRGGTRPAATKASTLTVATLAAQPGVRLLGSN